MGLYSQIFLFEFDDKFLFDLINTMTELLGKLWHFFTLFGNFIQKGKYMFDLFVVKLVEVISLGLI